MFEHKKEGFPQKEEEVLSFWDREGIFELSLQKREGAPLFSFYDGPPFATGLPHYGHILAGVIKDAIPRYKTMQGFRVPRRFGWDCHGLPVENEIEKAQQLSGASAIEAFGIGKFNEECRSIVLRYTQEWKKTVKRMGRWVSFENTYHTMDKTFMESVWWVFSQLYEKGLVYEGFKVMPFSTKLGTPLSNFEANLNYKEVDDPSLTVLFDLLDGSAKLLVWTTTPWTLPSNLAIMVRKDLRYAKIRKDGEVYILAEEALSRYFKEEAYEVLEVILGEQLLGKRYKPLFSYFSHRAEDGAFRVIAEESLSSEEGTGLVHSAPSFGEVDFYACLREKIDPVCPVDHSGKFTQEIVEFAGMYVKDADKEILKHLRKEGRVFHFTQVRHRYPFCWRSDTPLIYKTVRTWFVAVEKVKEKMLQANESIHWVPDHIKVGRFGKWLENARDWAISRNRYWGTPIPIWRSEDGEIKVISSAAQLEEKIGKKIDDLHRHFIDDTTFEEGGKVFRRIPEVFDCWFESGSMPYAQNHFPFENKKETMDAFPADFIGEGLDQTRGWFYTLTVLSSAIFDKPAFKNVIVNGILLAEDGNKMSKRLKNYPEPDLIFEKHGADAMRLYLLMSPAVQGEDLRFSERDLEKVVRQFLLPLWNSFSFLSTYATIAHWTPTQRLQPEDEIDRWILSLLQKTILEVTQAMDSYRLYNAIGPIGTLIEELTNWYIRRNRARFWEEEMSVSKQNALMTLYVVLKDLVKVLAPFAPFLSEAIYRQLRLEADPISVHLNDFPKVHASWRDLELETEMSLAQKAVSSGHALRKECKMKVRQPLSKAYLISSNPQILSALRRKENIIAEELNVKQIVFSQEENAFVDLIAKPNFRVLGKKVGGKMQEMQKKIAGLTRQELEQIDKGLRVELDDQEWVLTSEDIQIDRKVLEGVVALCVDELTVALDTTLNPALIQEGVAREFVNRINQLRKELDFSITDRIQVYIEASPYLEECFKSHLSYITAEILANTVVFQPLEGGSVCDVNGEEVKIALQVS